MLSQGWFWIALFALLLTARVDYLKGLFCLGLGIDLSCWLWAWLKEACRPLQQASEARARERQRLIDCAENEKRQEKERAHKLELEREATKRYEIFSRDMRQDIVQLRAEKASRIPTMAERLRAMKLLVDKLELQDDEKQALRDVIDRKLFLLLKGEIDAIA